MALTVLTDHPRIVHELDRFVAADPVRHTVLGTIGLALSDSAWAAAGPGRLAVRSRALFPLVVAGDWPDAAVAELGPLVRALPDLRGVSGPEPILARLLPGVRDGREVRRVGQRLFRLDELTRPTGVAGRARIAVPDDRDLVRDWVGGFLADVGDPGGDEDEFAGRLVTDGGTFVWVDGGTPVSMAARRPVIAGSARIGPVYTPPAARGHGYASGVTAAATASILADGGVPVLFTDLDNPTSNKIYQLLGYYPVEDRVVFEFS